MKTTKTTSKIPHLNNSLDGIYGIDAKKNRITPVKTRSDIATKVKYSH